MELIFQTHIDLVIAIVCSPARSSFAFLLFNLGWKETMSSYAF
ncbi:hypothetical protein LEP1GSC058_2250 [Leptospira fainei serovar Hurstbridge str. BUT 6]|uniref:Uncharacterized protein n=1 Tax=Leptospira fainei serovar Hurstbridge str. BUT 6 TaxID=1193011 RepID=S3VFT8_9LEPT|nr:hypothetical protein LEP1GSC058_2250 [Leptospira fainei serovar Hurstbridge str. BUT 6]